ncbi:MAG: Flp family type IVb pilin [Rhizobiales bacterium]|nr:Flp family type IVb pilin [Hyphomicrobiales bacterium]
MLKFSNMVAEFAHDQRGATAIEYGLIVAGVSATIIASLTALGVDIGAVFVPISAAISGI